MRKGKWIMVFAAAILFSSVLSACQFETEEKKEESPDYVIGVAAENAPYFYTDEEKKEAGVYEELMDALSETSSFSYKFEMVDAAAARQELEEGNIDGFLGTLVVKTGEEVGDADSIGSESENTAEAAAAEKISQSESFYESHIVILAAPDSGIKKLKDLKNQNIATRGETGEEKAAAYLAVKYEADEISFASVKDILSDVKSGYSQAAVVDEKYYEANPDLFQDWKTVKSKKKWENTHTLSVSENEKLLEAFQDGIKTLEKEGALEEILK